MSIMPMLVPGRCLRTGLDRCRRLRPPVPGRRSLAATTFPASLLRHRPPPPVPIGAANGNGVVRYRAARFSIPARPRPRPIRAVPSAPPARPWSSSSGVADGDEDDESHGDVEGGAGAGGATATTVAFNRRLDALAKDPDPGAALEAESLLREQLGRWRDEGGEGSEDGDDADDADNAAKVVRPDRFSFGAVIDAWARRSAINAEGPIRAEALLAEMRRLSDDGDDDGCGDLDVAPTTAEINAAINAWSKSSRDEAPRRAEALLRDMHDEYRRGGNAGVAPDAISFNTVIDAWANRCDGPGTAVDAAGRAEDVLRLMQDYHASRNDGGGSGSTERGFGSVSAATAKPNTRTYNAVIKAWSRAGSPERAGAVLQRMRDLRDGGNPDVRPDIYSHATVIDAWARTGAAEKAESVLTRMIEEGESGDVGGGGDGVEPNTACYNAVISAWARNGNKRIAARRASSILERMEELSSSRNANVNVRPNSITYGAVIHAWANSDEGGAGRRAEEVLARMERRHEESASSGDANDGDDGVRPNTVIYSSVINALARNGDKNSALRAEAILDRMRRLHDSGVNIEAKPNAITYGSVINAYSRAGDASRAEGVLRLLERQYDSSGDGAMKPNAVVYNTVIGAWARSGRRDAASKAEAAFGHMQRRHNETGGDPDVAPDTISYNSVIGAWSAVPSPDAKTAERAESILRVMEKNLDEQRHRSPGGGQNSVLPSTVSFGSVINAWARVGTADAAGRAEAVLQRMLDIHDAGAAGGGMGAETKIVPNATCFNSVINAWAKSNSPKQSIHAWNNLVRMEDLAASTAASGDPAARDVVAPNSITYNTVMVACAFTPERAGEGDRRKAMDIAVATMQKMEGSTSVRPDHIVYGTFLRACGNLLADGEERERIAGGVFGRCRRDGQVDDNVLMRLRAAAPRVFERMCGGESKARKLPEEWRCNVRPVRYRAGQKRDKSRK